MKVDFKNTFLKDLKKIRNQNLKNAIAESIIEVEKAENTSQISNIKKLVGYDNYYRIRVGSHRIGIKILDEIVYFVCFEHRKDIYRKFP